MKHVLRGLMVSAAGLVVLWSGTAEAATFTVTKTADTADGTCDADCSLREAIIAANANAEADTVTVPAGIYSLTIWGADEDAALRGDLDITTEVAIVGGGREVTAIEGDCTDRVLHVVSPGGVLTLSGTTVRNGGALDVFDCNLCSEGGGILVEGQGVLTLTDSRVTDSWADYAGGGIFAWGPLEITDSIVDGNSAGYEGGGINNQNAPLEITDSIIDGNSAGYEAGGVGVSGSGELVMRRSTVSGNTAEYAGGGISISAYWAGSPIATIIDSTIDGNSAGYEGGGINNSGYLTVVGSTIRNNEAAGYDESESAGDGGGIHNNSGMYGWPTASIINTTISGNRAFDSGGGVFHRGNTGPVVLNNVTVTNNVADFDGDGVGNGGGMLVGYGNPLTLGNSILAQNTDTGGEAPDCSSSGNLTSQGYNLIQDTTGCTISGDTTGVLTGVDPTLHPLQNNGGPTFTHAMFAGSPAIDAGNPAVPGSGGSACEATDQRGHARPKGVACDIGAFEASAVDHFKCYKAKDLKNPKFVPTTVDLTDQFGVNDGGFDVKKPFLMCNPAEKNNTGIYEPNEHLTCYKIKGPKLDSALRPQVEATDQFGTLRLQATKPYLLCVPSAKTVLP